MFWTGVVGEREFFQGEGRGGGLIIPGPVQTALTGWLPACAEVQPANTVGRGGERVGTGAPGHEDRMVASAVAPAVVLAGAEAGSAAMLRIAAALSLFGMIRAPVRLDRIPAARNNGIRETPGRLPLSGSTLRERRGVRTGSGDALSVGREVISRCIPCE